MSEPAVPLTAASTDRAGPGSEAPAQSRAFVGHARLIGALTFISRILGLGREVVFAHFFGTGLVATAFNVAFAVPNLFRKLFGEGALSAAFIPLYAQAVKKEGEEKLAVGSRQLAEGGMESLATALPAATRQPPTASNDFAAAGVNLLCAILLVITIIGELVLAGIWLLDRDMRLERALLLKFTAIMLPYVLLICGGAFLSGILQVHRRFGAPAAAPILLNVCHIAVVFLGAAFLGLHAGAHDDARRLALQTTLAYWLAVAVLVAGALQVAILLPGLRAVGFRFKLVAHVWTPPIKRMLVLTVPVALGAGVLQLSVFLDKGISLLLMQGVDPATQSSITHFSLLGHSLPYPMELGAPVRLSAAQLMYQFPLGIFAIALATAIFPALSTEAGETDRTRFRAVLRHGIEASLWEGLPASLGLILVAEPAVRLLFEHGQMTAHDTLLIARSLQLYAIAIWAFSLQQILNRAYYAIHDTTTPLVMSIVTLTINLAVELPLLWTPLAEAGMAAGTSASFILQALVMLWMINRRVGGLELRKSVAGVARMLLATAVMGLACLLVQHLPIYPRGTSRMVAVQQLALIVGTGAAVYFGMCALLGVEMLHSLRPARGRPRSG
jgi:putative peptidoglycan lipid II flippase